MNEYPGLAYVPFARTRAVIINCGTKWVSSLALASTLAHVDCPVLVIDCESEDGSRAHFRKLAQDHGLRFDWLSWPLRPHPDALQKLFAHIRAEHVLLVDSDVELKSSSIFPAMQDALAHDPSAYGAGFIHESRWLDRAQGLPPNVGYYAERMWIPFVMLRAAMIRRALQDGASFANRRRFLNSSIGPSMARVLAIRYRVLGFSRLPLSNQGTRGEGRSINGQRPKFIEYDTGADLHAALENSGHKLARLPVAMWGDIHHYHGVTRARLVGPLRRLIKAAGFASRDTETEQATILSHVRERLGGQYGIQVDDLSA
jgi:hypothetical protein